ncbi:MAG TPA: hypothetical protein VM142_13695 [Acidimicrobiales bacterium]|nr:hypothetical protein [Acidimicrobiales bacterium]
MSRPGAARWRRVRVARVSAAVALLVAGIPVVDAGLPAAQAEVGPSLCGLPRQAGDVLAWGRDDHGQLGDGAVGSPRALPGPVSGLGPGGAVGQVGAGPSHSSVLGLDGSVLTFGTAADHVVPITVPGFGPGSGATVIAAGGDISGSRWWDNDGAVKRDGSVWTWAIAAVDNGGNRIEPTPAQVPGLGPGSGMIALASSGFVDFGTPGFLALTDQGGVLFSRSSGRGASAAAPVPGLGPGSDVVAVSAGGRHNLALKRDGTVLSWGQNGDGQLGDGYAAADDPLYALKRNVVNPEINEDPPSQRAEPGPVAGLGSGSGVVAVAAGAQHSLALKADGTVLAWGANGVGQLGRDAVSGPSHRPAPVAGLGSGSGVVAVAAGGAHNLALKNDGTVLAWGDNTYGELGDGTFDSRPKPAQVAGMGPGSGVFAVAAGGSHSLAIHSGPTISPCGGSPQAAPVGGGFSEPLRALVVDAKGSPVGGVSVHFATPATGPGAMFARHAGSATVVTDAAGVATAPALTANNTLGSYSVVATTPGVGGTASFSLTNTTPLVIAPKGGGGQSAYVGAPFVTPLEVKVSDTYGKPVAGARVTFAAPATGPSGAFPHDKSSAAVRTDDAGTATAPLFTANAVAGAYDVVVSASTATPARLALANASRPPPPPAQGTITNAAGGTGEGPADNLGLLPSAMATGGLTVAGSTLYVVDPYFFNAVRAVDLVSGHMRTIAGGAFARKGLPPLTYEDGSPTVGDGGPAVLASLLPSGVAVDRSANVYVSDLLHNTVRRIDARTGVITTVAGTGTAGFSGDGGRATDAQLAGPHQLAFDAGGNLFVADSGNDRIRRIDTSGGITTVAGNGERRNCYGPSVAVGDGLAATEAAISYPLGVTFDPGGNLVVADTCGHRIRRVDRASATISTIAGDGELGTGGEGVAATTAQLQYPQQIAYDAAGSLYIPDYPWLNTVRRVDAAGVITTFAGNPDRAGLAGDGGPATAATLYLLSAVATDSAGNVYIAHEPKVRKVDPHGVITTLVGNGNIGSYGGDNGPAPSAQLLTPYGLAIGPANDVFIATHGRVRRIDNHNIIRRVAGDGIPEDSARGDGGPATEADLPAAAVALDASGNLYVAGGSRVRKVDTSGVITTVAGGGGDRRDGVSATSARLVHALGLAIDASGNLYIADAGDNRVRKVDLGGTITTVAGNGERGFSGDGGPATSARLNYPIGVVVDRSSNLYVADSSNNRIRKVATDGTITTVAGRAASSRSSSDSGAGGLLSVVAPALFPPTEPEPYPCAEGLGDGGAATEASLCRPSMIALDASGNLFVADACDVPLVERGQCPVGATSHNRVRKINAATGVISTVAGGRGFLSATRGDGGPATEAHIKPTGLAVAANGDLYISDTEADRVRVVRGPL